MTNHTVILQIIDKDTYPAMKVRTITRNDVIDATIENTISEKGKSSGEIKLHHRNGYDTYPIESCRKLHFDGIVLVSYGQITATD